MQRQAICLCTLGRPTWCCTISENSFRTMLWCLHGKKSRRIPSSNCLTPYRTLKMALEIKDELGTSYADLRQIKSKEAATKIQNIIFQNTGGSTNVAFDGSKAAA